MSKKISTIWEMTPHTKAKHIILRRYLDAWLPIMTRWNGRILYIDGFAGPGIYTNGEDGSPIIALKAALEHSYKMPAEIVYLFIEADEERCKCLEQRLSEFKLPGNIKYKSTLGKFDEAISGLLDYLDEQQKQIAPTFAFIDPFGFSHTPFSLVKRLMANPKCEILITFMYEEINRFLSDPSQANTYDELFGTDKWRQATTLTNPEDRRKVIHDVYKKQLEDNSGADISFVRSFEMINQGNKTDYFLFFGTNNIEGLKKMKEAMWKVDETSGVQFSDSTVDPNQPMLFKLKPNFVQLKRLICEKFQGQEISIEEIERFVLVDTPFRETHYKRQILSPLEKEDSPRIKVKRVSGKGRKGTYPPGTRIRFN